MKNVLLLESNTVLASTYDHALRVSGYSVVRTVNAQAAIDAADARPPDVVILELQLSGHGGIEFLHEFRSYPEWRHIPVIILTAIHASSIAPVRQALVQDLGVADILYKPATSLQDLLRAVRAQLTLAK